MGRWIGVIHVERSDRFLASIRRSGKQHHLGSWPTARLAAVAHDRAALFFDIGEQKLNFPKRSRSLGPAAPKELQRSARLRGRRFQGVQREPGRRAWCARIKKNGITYGVTGLESEQAAAVAHDRIALHLGIPLDRLNFPRRGLSAASANQLRAERFARRRARQTSSYRGVVLMSDGKHWRATVTVGYRTRSVHGFDSEREAAIARDRLALFLIGPDAELNFAGLRLTPTSFEALRKERVAARRERARSRYPGVSRTRNLKLRNPWVARLDRPGGRPPLHLGRWVTERKAALAVDRAALHYVGKHAKLNLSRLARKLGPADAKALKTLAWVEYKRLTKSRFRGVEPERQRWGAHIVFRGEGRRLGSFDTEEEAALAYDREAKRLFGAKARLNFDPETGEEIFWKMSRGSSSARVLRNAKAEGRRRRLSPLSGATEGLAACCSRSPDEVAHVGRRGRPGQRDSMSSTTSERPIQMRPATLRPSG